MNNTIYRKTSLNKISSPEQLNDYIKVSNPAAWVVLSAVFILLAGVIVWSITGGLPAGITANGISKDGEILCYLDQKEVARIKSGMEVKVNGEPGRIMTVSEIPLSLEEASSNIDSDFVKDILTLSQWNYKVMISVAESVPDDKIYYDISIITEKMAPIDFLLNR